GGIAPKGAAQKEVLVAGADSIRLTGSSIRAGAIHHRVGVRTTDVDGRLSIHPLPPELGQIGVLTLAVLSLPVVLCPEWHHRHDPQEDGHPGDRPPALGSVRRHVVSPRIVGFTEIGVSEWARGPDRQHLKRRRLAVRPTTASTLLIHNHWRR